MSFLDSIKNAQARRQSEYITGDCKLLLEIKNIVHNTNRKGREFIAVETYVLDSDNPTKDPKGSERTWLVMLDNDAAASNLRGFLCNALNVPDTALTDKMIDKAFSTTKEGTSPLAGVRVGCHARVITTKRGTPFTLCDWRPAGEEQEVLDF